MTLEVFFLATGTVRVQVYTANGAMPVVGATVSITRIGANGPELLALRITDANGQTSSAIVQTPDEALSEQPQDRLQPFATVDIRIDRAGYGSVIVEHVQVFANTQSVQNVELIPLPEAGVPSENVQDFIVRPQNL